VAARSLGDLCKARVRSPAIRLQSKGARLFAARPGDRGALDKTLAGQCHLEPGPRLDRGGDRGAGRKR
jgi:hypothetical protein